MEIRSRQNRQIQPKEEPETKVSRRGRKSGLTRRQRIFVYEYLSDNSLDPIEAYKKAGYRGKNNLHLLANQVLRNSYVQKEIERVLDMRFESREMDIFWLDHKLRQIADFDLRDCYHEDGTLKSPHEMDDKTIAALASIESEELFAGRGEDRTQIGRTKKIKVWDKLKTLELIGKRKSMFTEKVQLEGDLKVKAGVLVVPAPMSAEDWERMAKEHYQNLLMKSKQIAE